MFLISWSYPASAEQIKVTAGQPLCIDQDSLMAIVMAGILKNQEAAKSVTGCEGIAAGSKAEVIERYPSGTDFMRVVKVKVTSPNKPGPVTGFTIEIDK
jgi:hypothetical protein